MITLVFFLEERSAQVLLEGLLPRLLPPEQVTFKLVPFEGKQDLERQLVRKLRGWRKPDSYFVVLRDQDAARCEVVKEGLVALCREGRRPEALVRVACRELESWYLGDLAAVERALGVSKLAGKQRQRKYREPDRLSTPSAELAQLTGGRYQKVGGSRALGPELAIDGSNRSHSFNVFMRGVQSVVERAFDSGV